MRGSQPNAIGRLWRLWDTLALRAKQIKHGVCRRVLIGKGGGSNARPLDYAFRGRRSARCGTEMVVNSKCHCDEKRTASHKCRKALTQLTKYVYLVRTTCVCLLGSVG